MPNILLLETIEASAHQLLAADHRLKLSQNPASGLEEANLDQYVALITRGKGKVDRALIEAMPKLQVIARCGVGLDNVDVAAASERGIKVFNAPGVNTHTVAEHAMSLIMMMLRNLLPTILAVKDQNWSVRQGLKTDELRGKKLGIMGMGNIGQSLAKMAAVFGMEISYWDARSLDLPYQALDKESLLQSADVLSLHLPLLPDTQGLISREMLAIMKPEAIIINTARGQLIDQKALTEALLAGKLGGFAADVLAVEPPAKDEPLLQLPNVLVTPHSASLTATTYREMCVKTVNNVLALLADQPFEQKAWFNRP
ncbi:MAG: NAD(P)-dependent oxidoreductase [Bacteroidota bacterium]